LNPRRNLNQWSSCFACLPVLAAHSLVGGGDPVNLAKSARSAIPIQPLWDTSTPVGEPLDGDIAQCGRRNLCKRIRSIPRGPRFVAGLATATLLAGLMTPSPLERQVHYTGVSQRHNGLTAESRLAPTGAVYPAQRLDAVEYLDWSICHTTTGGV